MGNSLHHQHECFCRFITCTTPPRRFAWSWLERFLLPMRLSWNAFGGPDHPLWERVGWWWVLTT
jgi:hypothetical protein